MCDADAHYVYTFVCSGRSACGQRMLKVGRTQCWEKRLQNFCGFDRPDVSTVTVHSMRSVDDANRLETYLKRTIGGMFQIFSGTERFLIPDAIDVSMVMSWMAQTIDLYKTAHDLSTFTLPPPHDAKCAVVCETKAEELIPDIGRVHSIMEMVVLWAERISSNERSMTSEWKEATRGRLRDLIRDSYEPALLAVVAQWKNGVDVGGACEQVQRLLEEHVRTRGGRRNMKEFGKALMREHTNLAKLRMDLRGVAFQSEVLEMEQLRRSAS